ncbi:MAG: hypothetical protein A2934_05860 [Candidatus Sungbacteria bacterium RIFCSPLOWO2_01_FULL_47_10]|uniref:Uncharacterized protein n=1 Tax=Candidatus Sungbacteria bacterium RIFCSPLOWO2_01_FULL_47_10 TaxID=1802276 RepID=A0A1G2L7Q6_9BACT|nr:MAG: hypothetical protein A2934_05860 [Candidatus Sungbacteria bacterium RIFCSPLOWO2_01_FULL_47_10]
MIQFPLILVGAYLLLKRRVKISSKKELRGAYAMSLGVAYIAIAIGASFLDPLSLASYVIPVAAFFLVTVSVFLFVPSSQPDKASMF